MTPRFVLLLILLPSAITGCGSDADPATAVIPSQDAASHDDENGGHIALTPAQLKAASIELAEAGPAQIRETVPLFGAIAPNAERVREVAARFPGVIDSVRKKIGDAVREGETLATVEANESLQTYPVTTPLSGVVTARNANPGEQSGDKTLFTVADLATVWVELSLFPRDVAKVRVGQKVRVQSPDTGMSAQGNVVYVAPFGQAANQTLTARVLLDNPERRWAPGLYVTAEVTLAETAVLVAIRNEALQTLDGRTVVFAQRDQGFEPSAITLGRSDSEFSEVLAGLQAGDIYVTTNSFILKAELGKGEAGHEH